MWQTKYALAVPKNLGVGMNFRPCSEGYFLSGRLQSVVHAAWAGLPNNLHKHNAKRANYTTSQSFTEQMNILDFLLISNLKFLDKI